MNSVKNSKEDLARLFKQWASVSDLVVKGNRSADEVSKVLQEIISPTKEPLQFTEPFSHISACNLMDANYIGIPEACKRLKITLTEEQLQSLEEIPFSEDVLRECKDTHVLVADFGLSILEVRKRVKDELFYSHEDAWCNSEQFAGETSKPCWRLIRKDMVSRSTRKTWQEQQELLDETEEVPSAREMAYTISLNYLSTGERMFENTYVRTSTVRASGRHVDVGGFGRDVLGVGSDWDDVCHAALGVASSRK